MAFGVGLAVFAALVGVAAPRATAGAQRIVAARSPVWSDTGTRDGLRLETTTATVGDRPWTRVSVSGAGPRSPLPPGLQSWPPLGSTVASPALRRLVAAGGQVSEAVGKLAPTTIGHDGLTGPDELFSYTMTSASRGTGTPRNAEVESVVTGFGNLEAASAEDRTCRC